MYRSGWVSQDMCVFERTGSECKVKDIRIVSNKISMHMLTNFRKSKGNCRTTIFQYNDLELHHELHMKGQRVECNLTIKSSGATAIPCCLSSESASSLPRVGLRWCPGFSYESLMLSVAFSKSSPCKDFSASRASGVKYVFSIVSKYSSCKRGRQRNATI